MDKELLELCYRDFLSKQGIYNKMYDYFKGDTDVKKDYKMVTSRSNAIISTNFFKKFLKAEVSYSIGNDINYATTDGDEDVLEDIRYHTAHIPADHDIDLFKDMLIYSYAYELYSFDNEGNFNMTVLTPNESYAYENEAGEIEIFMHIFKKRFTDETIIKVYDDREITYYTTDWKVLDVRRHNFTSVPVGLARVSDELEDDSLYKDLKALQDALETLMSDSSNEISDFRNAYLVITGAQLEEEQMDDMKTNGVMMFGDNEGSVQWLTKNINDTFIQNTLENIEDKMYQVTNHINLNEYTTSNTSSLAIKAKLTELSNKCELQQKAFSNCIQSRIKFLFEYISFVTNSNYKGDWRNIQIKYTPNLPSDDLMTAELIDKLEGKVSLSTALSQLSFVENPEVELEKLYAEQEKTYGSSLPEFDPGDEVDE